MEKPFLGIDTISNEELSRDANIPIGAKNLVTKIKSLKEEDLPEKGFLVDENKLKELNKKLTMFNIGYEILEEKLLELNKNTGMNIAEINQTKKQIDTISENIKKLEIKIRIQKGYNEYNIENMIENN